MTLPRLSRCVLLLLPAVVAAASCSSGNVGSATFSGGTGGGAASGAGATTGAGGDAGLLGDAFGSVGSGGGSSGAGGDAGAPYLIYAHTDTTLFSLDPNVSPLALTQIGDFDCVGPYGTAGAQTTAMTDLAVDRDQNIYALSSYAVRQIDLPAAGDAGSADAGAIVHCHPEITVHVMDPTSTDPSYPWIKFEALSFAPVGVLDPNREMLVAGNTAGQLWVIDPSTATPTITQHGAFGTVPHDDGHGHDYMYPGGLWELSGDIVFLANDGNPVGFATVRDCPSPPDNSGCNYNDTLIEIDMTALGKAGTQSVTKAIRGMIVESPSCGGSGTYGFGSLFGIASWNAQVYGFSRAGDLVNISNVDGTACLVQSYPADLFSGAAVTTVAPVKPPPVN